mgnify:CR=1 FL=1
MTNLFKRNKTYYIRLSLNDNLKIYFGNKTEYVKSLNTNNINNARLIAKYLISKFNYIKRSFNMLDAKEIKQYIDEFKKTDYLLPMCLQMLVENTIQHNETSQANPLQVIIYTENNSLIIENPIKLRSNIVDSTKTGLKNIELRYSFYTDEKVIVINNEKVFKVILHIKQKK